MIRYILATVILCCAPAFTLTAKDAPPAGGDKKTEPGTQPPKEGASLPKDVLNFFGKVTGTVAAVDLAKSELKVKVASAEADADKNKAPKPEALSGMTITVTPLQKGKDDGTQELDEAGVAYIKGAKAGDAVNLAVRTSSKGGVFRLLKVPVAAGGK